jgi:stage IV sporulation protein FA
MEDVKSNVKKRREERIRQLTAGDIVGYVPEAQQAGTSKSPISPMSHPADSRASASTTSPSATTPSSSNNFSSIESDPELVWKHNNPWKNKFEDNIPDKSTRHKSYFWRGQGIRLLVCVLIFGAIYGIQNVKTSWSFPVQSAIVQSLTHEMDFSKVEVWYEDTFGGSPSFIPIFKHNDSQGVKVEGKAGFVTPLQGKIVSSFAISMKGIEIIPNEKSASSINVQSISTGRVIAVNQDAVTGKTVVIQHTGGYISSYGRMEQVFVQKNDWIEGGEWIGSLPATTSNPQATLYFSIEKDKKYIDPTDVIMID